MVVKLTSIEGSSWRSMGLECQVTELDCVVEKFSHQAWEIKWTAHRLHWQVISGPHRETKGCAAHRSHSVFHNMIFVFRAFFHCLVLLVIAAKVSLLKFPVLRRNHVLSLLLHGICLVHLFIHGSHIIIFHHHGQSAIVSLFKVSKYFFCSRIQVFILPVLWKGLWVSHLSVSTVKYPR